MLLSWAEYNLGNKSSLDFEAYDAHWSLTRDFNFGSLVNTLPT